MKILITGTTGFIGRSLKEFYETSHEVFDYVRGTSLHETLQAIQPNVIINCSGEIYNANKMFKTNVGLVEEILEWMKCNPTARLIQMGSSAEYGPLTHPSSEITDKINPIDVYQATKGAATLLCQGYARQFKLQTTVARVFSAFGPYERPYRLFPSLYRAFFQNEPMTLFDGVHDFIYIDDFVRGIDLLVNGPAIAGEVVNFGSGISHTNLEILKLWEEITGLKAPITYEDRLGKAYESKYWVCDTLYAEGKYQFKTKFTLEDGIRDFIKKKQNV